MNEPVYIALYAWAGLSNEPVNISVSTWMLIFLKISDNNDAKLPNGVWTLVTRLVDSAVFAFGLWCYLPRSNCSD